MHVASSIFGAALLAVASAEVCVNVRTRSTMKEVVVTKTLEVTEIADCPSPTGNDFTNLFPSEWPSDLIPTLKPTLPADPVPSVHESGKPPVVTTITTTSVVTECEAAETDCVVGVTSTITITTTTDCDDDVATGVPSISESAPGSSEEPSTTGADVPASTGEPNSPASEGPATSITASEDGTTSAAEATPTSDCDDDESPSTTDSEYDTTSAAAASSTDCDDEDLSTPVPSSPASSSGAEESSVPEPSSTECDDDEASSTPVASSTDCEEETSSPVPTSTPNEDDNNTPVPSSTSCEDEENSSPATTSIPSDDDSSTPVPSSTSCEDETTTAEAPDTTAVEIPATTEIVATTEPEPTTLATVTLPAEQPTSSVVEEEPEPEPTMVRAYPADIVDKLQDESMEKLKRYLAANPPSNGCTLEKAHVRREWGDLSVAQREEYVAAVKCLQKLPTKLSAREVPGARSRFDDFVYTHISQTNNIHNTANFLSWHRYYVHAYEKALRDECGYTGAHPYWNWDRYAADLAGSPLFNGESGSLGGGCGRKGPFSDMVVNLGPGSSLQHNPRCLTRDLSKEWAKMTTVAYSHPLIANSESISAFQDRLQASPGVHAGGHFSIGGDPGSSIHASPGDPAFYLHHAGVDRIWWIWQLQNLEERLKAVDGRVVGSRVTGSLNDPIHMGINGDRKTIRDMMDTMGGDLCYIYY